jgi:hypothetical protein
MVDWNVNFGIVPARHAIRHHHAIFMPSPMKLRREMMRSDANDSVPDLCKTCPFDCSLIGNRCCEPRSPPPSSFFCRKPPIRRRCRTSLHPNLTLQQFLVHGLSQVLRRLPPLLSHCPSHHLGNCHSHEPSRPPRQVHPHVCLLVLVRLPSC